MNRVVRYFEEYGEANTKDVIQVVLERLQDGGINTVVVASSSGKTAVAFAEALRAAGRRERVIVVAEPPPESSGISPATRAQLEGLDVEIVDYMPYASMAYSAQAAENVYGALDLLVVVFDAFRMVGGNGLKVAIEVGLMATNAGKVAPGQEIIAVGGTAGGADTAIVMKTAFSRNIFAKDPAKRPEVREILAMPKTRKWWW